MRILAIDPGNEESAYVVLNTFDRRIDESGKLANADLLAKLLGGFMIWDAAVIEQIASFGMAVGAEVFETVFWSGRFAQAMDGRMGAWHRIGRGPIKMHLCGSMRARDGNIRQALIDKYGGAKAIAPQPKCVDCRGKGKIKGGKHPVYCQLCKATGRYGNAGALHGLSGDVWSSLAVAVTWAETVGKSPPASPGAGSA